MRTYEFIVIRKECGVYEDIKDALLCAKYYCNSNEEVIAIVEVKGEENAECE